ncbi:MAG: transmembrane Mn(2+) transporter [Pirellulales bacterium]
MGIVGQSLAISAPITGDYNRLLRQQETYDEHKKIWEDTHPVVAVDHTGSTEARAEIGPRPDFRTHDDQIWAGLIAVVTSAMLMVGRYGLVQHVSTLLVAMFTVMSIANLFALQSQPAWAIHADDIWHGLSLQIPKDGLTVALSTFGIIGVGASELVAYPYWCLEKGYARAAGVRDASDAWGRRAKGWFRVMCWDAWCSMGIYTFATIAFYLTGATILNRVDKVPDNSRLIPTLMEMYKPVFGTAAEWVFLFGAFAVLYSTFFAASAGNARIAADALRVFRCGVRDEDGVKRWTQILSGAIPLISFLIYFVNPYALTLVLVSGFAQAVMLPMLGFAALYYRYYRCDVRLKPGLVWTICLWLSFGVLMLTGGVGVFKNVDDLIKKFF